MNKIFFKKVLLIATLTALPFYIFADTEELFTGYGNNEEVAINLPDGIYLYEIEQVDNQEDLDAIQSQNSIVVDLKSTRIEKGLAVEVVNRTFLEPYTNIIISIDNRGNLSCPDNSSIRGKLNSSCKISWTGSFTIEYEAMQTGSYESFLETEGTLELLPLEKRANSAWDGVYYITEENYYYPLVVEIKNGFMTMKTTTNDYGIKLPEGCGIYVKEDGTYRRRSEFYNDCDVISTAITYNSNSYNTHIIEGRISEEGILFNVITQNYVSTDNTMSETKHVGGGNLISSYNNADIEDILNNQSTPPDMSQIPEWYINPDQRDRYITDTGTHSHADREIALRLAEIKARANLSYQIQTYVRSLITDYYNDKNGEVETEWSEAISDISYLIFPTILVKSEYNEETESAYTEVMVSEEDASNVYLIHFEELGLSSNPFQW